MAHPAPPPVPAAKRTAPAAAAAASATDAALRADLGDRLARALARRRGEYVTGLVRDGVSAAQMSVLMRLRYLGDVSITGLADLLGLGLPNVTGLVDRLEERGLVERRRDPADRRVVRVHLTAAGGRIPDGMEGLQRDVLGRVLQAMDRETLERCLAVLDEVEKEAGPTPSDPRCAGRVRHERA
jgi:DNA-binding MarR family transcriptional regulator